MKILLTGATGFLGSHFRNYCLAKGHTVLVLGRFNPKSNHEILGLDNLNFEKIVCDFSPDIIFDLASHFDLSPVITSNNLIEGTFTFHLKLSNLLKQFEIPWIYTSSYWQLLRKPDGAFISDYHFLKHTIEEYLEASHRGRFHSVVLFDTYGPFDSRRKIVQTLIEMKRDDKKLELSPGHQLINLTHVDDVCSGLLQVGSNVKSQESREMRQFLASREFISLRQLVETVEKLKGFSLPVSWGAKPYRPGEILVSPEPFSSIPNWISRIPLDEGLRNLI